MHYIDSSTGATYPLSEPRWRGDSGGHLNLGDAPGLTRAQIDASVNSLWRYREALLVDAGDAVTLGEGWTPLTRAQWDGIPVLMKLDYLMPSGSFKDRGMTVMVTYLKRHGVTDVLEDSSGNAGASLSIYCAAAGTRCRVLVPATASYPKIAQIAACGAEVVAITGTRQDVADAALAMSREIFYASHNWQPLFAEGRRRSPTSCGSSRVSAHRTTSCSRSAMAPTCLGATAGSPSSCAAARLTGCRVCLACRLPTARPTTRRSGQGWSISCQHPSPQPSRRA